MNKLYIDGKWVNSQSESTISVFNPATEIEIAKVSDCSKDDVVRAVNCASYAFQSWRNSTGETRYHVLKDIYNIILENKEELAKTLSQENGKPYNDALGEILFGASYLLWYAEEAKRLYGEVIPSFKKNNRIKVIKQPVGVVAIITPWNYPFAMMARKFATAIAAGCTVVVKPSELTPLTALQFFEYINQSKLPRGVANLVVGNPNNIGETLMASNKVSKVTFTGSTRVGKLLMKQAADSSKRVSLELGGHAPFIVFEDANIDDAVEGAIIAKFKNNGQACVCGNRFYIHERIINKFVDKFIKKTKQLKLGSWDDKNADVGPIINESQIDKINNQLDDALRKGAELKIGGKRSTKKGYFYEPTVITNIQENMDIYYNETFGPIAPFISFSEEEEVLEKANDSSYGLAAYFYTQDVNKVTRVAEKLEYGVIGINDSGPATSYQAPFGGVKESGLGREGGHFGIDEFLEIKYISLNIKEE